MRKRKQGTSTDVVLTSVYNALVSDFSRDTNGDFSRYKVNRIKDARSIDFPSYLGVSTPIFKRLYQLQKFFSRYTAVDDIYSPSQVELMTVESLEKDTTYAAQMLKHEWKYSSILVMREARKIAKEILGPFDKNEWYSRCRFGRRASQGVPLQESYLHNKVKVSVSCSSKIQRHFMDYLAGDTLLVEGLVESAQAPNLFSLCDALTLSLVPKKFDKLRPVTPYSTAASFLSLGIGDYMRSRLLTCRLDLSRLQDKHRKAVLQMSLRRDRVTADMKAASTLITSRHVNSIIPRDWYTVLKDFHIDTLIWNGNDVHKKKLVLRTNTFGGMGCGFTFPLQTLIFYSILVAIGRLTNSRTERISVYGDDLIYPRNMHKYVSAVFADIGFIINNDKTFVNEYFRESCGEDAHHGVSVRPFCYEGGTEVLRGPALGAFLFKLYNGLKHRWRPLEISGALHVLKQYISASYGFIHLVPSSFPDYSGIKTDWPLSMEWWTPLQKVRYHRHFHEGKDTFLRSWQFTAISANTRPLVVPRQHPYYWETLRASGSVPDTQYMSLDDSVVVAWKRSGFTRSSELSGKKRIPRYIPTVAEKGSVHFARASGRVLNWIEKPEYQLLAGTLPWGFGRTTLYKER